MTGRRSGQHVKGIVDIGTINEIEPALTDSGLQKVLIHVDEEEKLLTEDGALVVSAHVLDEVLAELKKMNFYLSLMTDTDLES